MATPIRLQYVGHSESRAPHECIAAVGGFGPNGVPWKISQREAVRGVEEDRWTFFVRNLEGTVDPVVVAHTTDGAPYLKSVGDGEYPDTLIRLPEAPAGV